jgi:hypothetical protein
MHEGRSWYTPHRGRLWIHAAAKEPDSDIISQMIGFYKARNTGKKKLNPIDNYLCNII